MIHRRDLLLRRPQEIHVLMEGKRKPIPIDTESHISPSTQFGRSNFYKPANLVVAVEYLKLARLSSVVPGDFVLPRPSSLCRTLLSIHTGVMSGFGSMSARFKLYRMKPLCAVYLSYRPRAR